MTLQGKNIVLAVTGSIAAYKAAVLLRTLVKEGCAVQVLMTDAATEFVSPLTFATLSHRQVYTNIVDKDQWNSHVELGLWADAMVIAPATANTLSRLATAQADNMVVATYLSARCPVFVAPAMDLDMWAHPSNQRNIRTLKDDGVHIIPVGHGELASGLVGDGRMAEPDDITAFLRRHFEQGQTFAGKHVLITAGPTHEAIDPVRYIGNPSTGKMGLAIAESFASRGAAVTVVLGPVTAGISSQIRVIPVHSAAEMLEATLKVFPECDIAILSAAVADYTPAHPSKTKIKKEDGPETLQLKRTKDIAMEIGKLKKNGQVVVGFALETNRAEEHAKEKLQKKNFDFIVLNTLEDPGAGFGHDTNKVKFIYPGDQIRSFELKTKAEVADDICDAIAELTS